MVLTSEVAKQDVTANQEVRNSSESEKSKQVCDTNLNRSSSKDQSQQQNFESNVSVDKVENQLPASKEEEKGKSAPLSYYVFNSVMFSKQIPGNSSDFSPIIRGILQFKRYGDQIRITFLAEKAGDPQVYWLNPHSSTVKFIETRSDACMFFVSVSCFSISVAIYFRKLGTFLPSRLLWSSSTIRVLKRIRPFNSVLLIRSKED